MDLATAGANPTVQFAVGRECEQDGVGNTVQYTEARQAGVNGSPDCTGSLPAPITVPGVTVRLR